MHPAPSVLALKFLLHFVGDLHQPLHAADSLDLGGNTKRVSTQGFRLGNLHHFWDTSFVAQLGVNPETIAADPRGHLFDDQGAAWSKGTPADWAMETFVVARDDDAYGQLPAPPGAAAIGSTMAT